MYLRYIVESHIGTDLEMKWILTRNLVTIDIWFLFCSAWSLRHAAVASLWHVQCISCYRSRWLIRPGLWLGSFEYICILIHSLPAALFTTSCCQVFHLPLLCINILCPSTFIQDTVSVPACLSISCSCWSQMRIIEIPFLHQSWWLDVHITQWNSSLLCSPGLLL